MTGPEALAQTMNSMITLIITFSAIMWTALAVHGCVTAAGGAGFTRNRDRGFQFIAMGACGYASLVLLSMIGNAVSSIVDPGAVGRDLAPPNTLTHLTLGAGTAAVLTMDNPRWHIALWGTAIAAGLLNANADPWENRILLEAARTAAIMLLVAHAAISLSARRTGWGPLARSRREQLTALGGMDLGAVGAIFATMGA